MENKTEEFLVASGLDQLRDQLAGVHATLTPLKARIIEIDDAIDVLDIKKINFEIGGPNRKDALNALCEEINLAAADYKVGLTRGPLARLVSPNSSNLGAFGTPLTEMFWTKGGLDESAVAFFFGDLIKKKLKAEIVDLKWRGCDGPDKDCLDREISDVRAKIEALRREKAEILETMRSAGFSIEEELVSVFEPTVYSDGSTTVETDTEMNARNSREREAREAEPVVGEMIRDRPY